MKQVYLVETFGCREPVVFADRDSAVAVAEMAGATVREVRIIDLDSACLDDWTEGGDGDAV